MIKIGIDPGVKTGFAVSDGGCLVQVETLKIHQAMHEVLFVRDRNIYRDNIHVVVEDARKRGGLKVRAQGAGSVKRDCKIWEDFLIDNEIDYCFVKPDKKLTKISEETFKRMTKWGKRTSNHARDAAMLIFGL